MNRIRVAISIAWSIVTTAVFIIVFALAEKPMLSAGLAGVSSIVGIVAISYKYMSWLAESRIGDRNWRSAISESLSGKSRFNEILACTQLAVASGNRYGILRKESAAHWRNWWELHREQLKWDPTIGRLVENEEGELTPIEST